MRVLSASNNPANRTAVNWWSLRVLLNNRQPLSTFTQKLFARTDRNPRRCSTVAATLSDRRGVRSRLYESAKSMKFHARTHRVLIIKRFRFDRSYSWWNTDFSVWPDCASSPILIRPRGEFPFDDGRRAEIFYGAMDLNNLRWI